MYYTFLTTEHWNIVGIGETEAESQQVVIDTIKNDYGYDLSFDEIQKRYFAHTHKTNKLIMWTNNCVATDNSIEI